MASSKSYKIWWSGDSLTVAIIVFVLGAAISLVFAFPNTIKDLGINLGSGIVLGIAGYALDRLTAILTDAANTIKDNTKTMNSIRILEEDMKKYFPFAFVPLHYDGANRHFDDKLKLVERLQDRSAKQIAEKFIANKLHANFEKLKFEVNAEKYSQLSSEFYKAAKSSIILANSFDPYEWASVMLNASNLESKLQALAKPLKNEDFEVWYNNSDNGVEIEKRVKTKFKHFEEWYRKTDVNKKRLVILCDMVWDNLFLYESFYRFFMKLNKFEDNEIRFITLSTLKKLFKNKQVTYIDVVKTDYAFFDKKISMEWDIVTVGNNTNPTLSLEGINENTGIDERYKFIELIDEIWTHRELTYRVCDVEGQINETRSIYINKIREKQAIPHSYCYHAYGADCWKKINKGMNVWYTLGKNEQSFLEQFLYHEKMQSHIKVISNCNILHIGVGSGIEIEHIVNSIGRHPRVIEKYALVDISQNILQKTREIQTILNKKNGGKDLFVEICMDAVEGNLKSEIYDEREPLLNQAYPLIIVLVANGFLLSQENLLKNIAGLMKSGDYLLVTTETGAKDPNYLCKQGVLDLFNVSLNPLGITITEADKNYLAFDFKKDATPVYKKDVFTGYLKLKEMITDGRWSHDKISQSDSFLNNIDNINFFESYKPSNLESFKSYLKAINSNFAVEYNSGFDESGNPDSNSDLSQVGFVIKKK
ncbi:MAG: hypothetical protein FWD47_11760 [Treponema sp.]|nr:hypothetical protein [Treponema sp.]